MQAIKQHYINAAHFTGSSGAVRSFSDSAKAQSAYGYRRWMASLFAIYNTEKMVELDLPWWNVAATQKVEEFLASRNAPTVFEYGAGASTIWLSRRADTVTSIEHDAQWHRRFLAMINGQSNIQLQHRALGDAGSSDAYVGAIEETDARYDLIVVDGRHRSACLHRAMSHLKPGAMVLFDDSGRGRYREGIAQSGLVEERFFGRSFCVPYPDYTSLLTYP
ncbi:class I SAM-dependent methyltransferase [Parasphingorhabdus sp. DH2-15]|uniref:class I SAM-dependent methyltransferase n=1 Tax=Parasphingorhabdus sp. DH2-15 TaxID=3444112 RepID=UPI003F688CDB